MISDTKIIDFFCNLNTRITVKKLIDAFIIKSTKISAIKNHLVKGGYITLYLIKADLNQKNKLFYYNYPIHQQQKHS